MTRPASEPRPWEVALFGLIICIPLAALILTVLCMIWVVG